MEVRPVAIAVVALTICCLDSVDASTIRVVDFKGAPVSGAHFACIDPAGEVSVTDVRGLGVVSDACRRLSCRAEGFVSEEVLVADETECRLRPAAIPVFSLGDEACSDCRIELSRKASPEEVIAEAAFRRIEPDGPLHAELPPVSPGRYMARVLREGDDWQCRAPLSALGPGRHRLAAVWRVPVSVVGRVADAEGRSVEGAIVRTRAARYGEWFCGHGASFSDPSSFFTSTGADGTFRVDVDSAHRALVVAGSFDDPRGLAVAVFRGEPAVPLVMRLTAPVRLRGLVAYEDDAPAACEAHLFVNDPIDDWLTEVLDDSLRTSRCDEEGRFELGPFRAAPFSVEVQPAPGLPITRHEKEPTPGKTVDLGVLRANTGESFSVSVRDEEDGTAIAGADVTATVVAGVIMELSGMTDGEGSVELTGAPKEARLALEVDADGYATAKLDGLELSEEPFLVTMARGTAVRGLVVDLWGEPIPEASLLLLSAEQRKPLKEMTDGDGRFAFEGVPAGAITLKATAPGYRQSASRELTLERGEVIEDIQLELEEAEPLRGRVLAPDGAPKRGARVEVIRPGRAGPASAITESAADGIFEVTFEVREGERLVATAPGYGPGVESSPMARRDQLIELRLTPPARLAARLPSDLPVGAMLEIRDGLGVARNEVIDGRTLILIEDLGAGDAYASITGGPGKSFELVAGQTVEVDFDLGAAIEGIVTLDGVPAARAVITTENLDDKASDGEGKGLTDERGFFRFEGIKAGRLMVAAITPSGRAERSVDVPAEGTITADIQIESVLLEVVVTDEDGRPVAGAGVQTVPEGFAAARSMSTGSVIRTGGGSSFRYTISNCKCAWGSTGSSGRLRLPLPEQGPVDVSVQADGFEPWNGKVDLGVGETPLDVQLEPKAILTLRVELTGERSDLEGLLRCAFKSSSTSSTGIRGPRFECTNPQPGPGTVTFVAPGYGSAHTAVEVPEEGEVTISLTLGRGGTLVVPVSSLDTEVEIVDTAGVDWMIVLQGLSQILRREIPQIGSALVIPDLPPGVYTVRVNGSSRAPIDIRSGEKAIAW